MRSLVLFVTLITSSALAQDAGATAGAEPTTAATDAGTAAPPEPPPSGDEIKRVLDYQENGKDRGPALMDLLPCLKVDQKPDSPTKSFCIEPVTGPLKKGTVVYAWMHWFIPKGGKYDDVVLQWIFNGELRSTVDLVVQGFSRLRINRPLALTKVGTWQIRVMQGKREIGTTSITVEQ